MPVALAHVELIAVATNGRGSSQADMTFRGADGSPEQIAMR
jgi:hypothetical protein